MVFEANLDGIVGPTHNYAGLSYGNVASEQFSGRVSHPKKAALQGLEKMRLLHQLGVKQLVMPPHPRPALSYLGRLGYKSNADSLKKLAEHAPLMLARVYSASGMWAANAATVAPASDTKDGKVHFTPANLVSTVHRSLEPEFTSSVLQRIFPEGEYFAHHAPLPAHSSWGDEGAANHLRLQTAKNVSLNIFVYGSSMEATLVPTRYPARQTLQASQAVARLNALKENSMLFVQQHPDAIDAGVFHDDVIAVSHEHVLLYHECAFAEGDLPIKMMKNILGDQFLPIKITESELFLREAVQSYFFNSQIVTNNNNDMVMIAPIECQENPSAREVIRRLCDDPNIPITRAHFVNLRESMRNGGGPACLRLRVVLDELSWAAVHEEVKFSDDLYGMLKEWIALHYREELAPEDLADPSLIDESYKAVKALEEIVNLKGLYDDII